MLDLKGWISISFASIAHLEEGNLAVLYIHNQIQMKPILILLAAATAGLAYPGLPPFLGNLSRVAQQTYRQITDDNKLTVNQVRDKLAAWAKKYNVSKELNEFYAREEEDWKKMKKNVENLLEELSTLYKQILKIRENKDKSIAEIENEVEEIRLRNPTLFEIIRFAERQFDKYLRKNHLKTRGLSNDSKKLSKRGTREKRSARDDGKRKGRRGNGKAVSSAVNK
ncbi:unnamed protein product [Haemonchus placei]|uniref:SXP/RAL-2 family protein Ani s 5-like cation-binding domain-containing protein n=1 Tax=Haemonchus placei TaxID=6290 RepID=A0A3P7WDC5_HAEPC|nr:unnamed protein product [Haemonchus placei]